MPYGDGTGPTGAGPGTGRGRGGCRGGGARMGGARMGGGASQGRGRGMGLAGLGLGICRAIGGRFAARGTAVDDRQALQQEASALERMLQAIRGQLQDK